MSEQPSLKITCTDCEWRQRTARRKKKKKSSPALKPEKCLSFKRNFSGEIGADCCSIIISRSISCISFYLYFRFSSIGCGTCVTIHLFFFQHRIWLSTMLHLIPCLPLPPPPVNAWSLIIAVPFYTTRSRLQTWRCTGMKSFFFQVTSKAVTPQILGILYRILRFKRKDFAEFRQFIFERFR